MKRASREFGYVDEKARDTRRVILILRLGEKIKGRLFNVVSCLASVYSIIERETI